MIPIFTGGMFIIHAYFKGKWLGTALQIYFMGDSLALLIGPMLNTLFVEKRNSSLISNSVNGPQWNDIDQPSASLGKGNSTSWIDSTVLTIKSSSEPWGNLTTSNDQSMYILNEYTRLAHYYMFPVMSMTLASIASFYICCSSKTVKNVLSSRQKTDGSGSNKVSRKNDFDETILLAGIVILEFCRDAVGSCAFGLMVTYMVKHLKMGKTTAPHVTSSWSLTANLSQLVGIVLIRFIPAPTLLGISLFTVMVINVAFTLSIDNHIGMVWIWAMLSGAFLPFVKISVYTWFYQAITVTAFRTSLILVGLTGGTMVGSALAGYLMTLYNPGWFVYSLDGMLICFSIVFVVTFVYYSYMMKKRGCKLIG